jgi:hypothetical protein
MFFPGGQRLTYNERITIDLCFTVSALNDIVQLLPLKDFILRLAVFMHFPLSECWILESFPDFVAKRDQLICASLVAN